MPTFNDIAANYWQHPIQYTTAAMSAGTMSAGWITGAPIVVLNSNGVTPGTQTTRTATQLVADGSLCLGHTWLLIIFNSVTSNTMTLAAGSGVTLSGTTTVAPFSARVYSCTVTNATTPAITITGLFAIGGSSSNLTSIA